MKISTKPTLALAGNSFQTAHWGSLPQMATVKYLGVKLAFSPLLRGRIQTDRLFLKEPEKAKGNLQPR